MMHGRGKSDSAIVAGKPTNKAGQTRRVDQTLAMLRLFVLPSAFETASAPGTNRLSRLNGWPMPSPTDASSPSSRTPTHGSGPM